MQLSIKLKNNKQVVVEIEGERETLVDIISLTLENDEKFAQLMLDSIIRWKINQQDNGSITKICMN